MNPSTLTDNEIRIAVAKALKYSVQFINDGVERTHLLNPEGFMLLTRYGKWELVDFPSHLPNYTESLDAMHEAEKVMTAKQWNKYVVSLARVIAEAQPGQKVQVPTNVLLSATARQRALAFLATLNP